MPQKFKESKKSENRKPTVTLTGKVEKIIPALHPAEPEKIQIAVDGAEDLYREIRVENKLQNKDGKTVSLKKGADVDVTIEADPEATKPDPSSDSKPTDT
jgi:hypothetical protein